MSCSQNRSTAHPSLLSLRVTYLSLAMLRSILSRQYLPAGLFLSQYLYPCQKSPSQNTAILRRRLAKSGLPVILGYISNLAPDLASIFSILRSIAVPLLRMRDMRRERASGVRVSATRARAGARPYYAWGPRGAARLAAGTVIFAGAGAAACSGTRGARGQQAAWTGRTARPASGSSWRRT